MCSHSTYKLTWEEIVRLSTEMFRAHRIYPRWPCNHRSSVSERHSERTGVSSRSQSAFIALRWHPLELQ
jgi:hypothetical protein